MERCGIEKKEREKVLKLENFATLKKGSSFPGSGYPLFPSLKVGDFGVLLLCGAGFRAQWSMSSGG